MIKVNVARISIAIGFAALLSLPLFAMIRDIIGLSDAPSEVVHSGVAPDFFVKCLTQMRPSPQQTKRLSSGVIEASYVNGRDEDNVLATFSIYPEGRGSRIELRHEIGGMFLINWRQCLDSRS